MGYHPGLEDDGIYLTAVKARLNRELYPHDAQFFRLQMQATVFDGFMAHFVRWTRMPLAWAELFWQLAALFLILWASKKILDLLFFQSSARWAGVALVGAMFTLPVSGSALYMADQHLHPRNLATALILLAVWRILADRRWQAVPLLLAASLLHPLMAAFGISFCVFLALVTRGLHRMRPRAMRSSVFAIMPLGWVFESGGPAWRTAIDARPYLYLYKWTWYEWLGALAPLLFIAWLWRFAQRRGETRLARFAAAALFYGLFQQALAMILLSPFVPARLIPLQPMRYLHIEYFLLMMTAGAMLGRFLLKKSVWRWTVFLLAVYAPMFACQRAEFANVPHLELPGRPPSNSWLQAFAWIKANTPTNAYFALDPHYLEAPGEDFHSFRALAERSQLADAVKDTTVVTQVPELAPLWDNQVRAQQGWHNFTLADFNRLKTAYGVDWVLVAWPQPPGLGCSWHNNALAVCRIPGLSRAN
ncbi:MAG: hypothetical protein WBP85_09570 [Terracidiphilus sp.]